ncbi:hypothetical protein [Streptomyces sp. NPDC047718]|uniref:hypothetical protein n=1 Tax=Streptomyces sp. NPDC047718 TaxID=3155479 RepID=UPI0033D71E7D
MTGATRAAPSRTRSRGRPGFTGRDGELGGPGRSEQAVFVLDTAAAVFRATDDPGLESLARNGAARPGLLRPGFFCP